MTGTGTPMEIRFKVHGIHLVLLKTICTTTVEQNWYQKLETGQNITGEIGAELAETSNRLCSLL